MNHNVEMKDEYGAKKWLIYKGFSQLGVVPHRRLIGFVKEKLNVIFEKIHRFDRFFDRPTAFDFDRISSSG